MARDQAEHVEELPQIVRIVAVARDHETSLVDLVVGHPVRVRSGAWPGDRPGPPVLAHISPCAPDAHPRLPVRPSACLEGWRDRSVAAHVRPDRAPLPIRINDTTPVAVTCTLPITLLRRTPLPG